jgi:hypothetical protein
MKTNIREYREQLDVEIEQLPYAELGVNRWVVYARNEAGYNGVEVDLEDIIAWVKETMPELLV